MGRYMGRGPDKAGTESRRRTAVGIRLAVMAVALGALWWAQPHIGPSVQDVVERAAPPAERSIALAPARDTTSADRSAAHWSAGDWVEGEGTVVKVLPDDRQGSPHQRFILLLPDERTVLVAHNIELASRLQGLSAGDTVAFRGEFQPNDRGGVIHWTHHDPQGRHAGGWLSANGQRVE